MHIPSLHLFIPPLDDLPGGIDLPQISSSTAAGIGAAIAGNVLISLALNCQKLAHRRLEREREDAARTPQPLHPTHSDGHDHIPGSPLTGDITPTPSTPTPAIALLETDPLLESAPLSETEIQRTGRRWLFSRRKTHRHLIKEADRSHLASTHALMPVDVVHVRPASLVRQSDGGQKNTDKDQNGSESDYLKSKLWWVGFLLMNLGETGNFISYAFAPASVVAPLGTFALIANCIFAPLMLKERFRKRDFVGIIIAILGAVTVVLSANPSNVRLNPDGLIKAISQRPFGIYVIVYVVGVVILSGLSEGPAGKRWVYVDIGLCALFGGFTVLSTKAVSTLLTLEWFQIFKEWITYPVVAVLLVTGVGQIRYLNRALMRFDSKIVVPTQFVMFNLSAIVGSAILYGDFKKATFHQLVTFLYGCGATFAGVFIIAWASPTPPGEHDLEEDDDVGIGGDDTPTLPGSISTAEPPSTEDGAPASVRVRKSSLARRNRDTLIIPDGADADAASSPSLRNRHSFVSLYGLSPAQRVLLISSSPRDEFVRPAWQQDLERDGTIISSGAPSPDSGNRRRAAVGWRDDDTSRQASPRANRRYGATSATQSRDHSRSDDRMSAPSRSRSASPDPFS